MVETYTKNKTLTLNSTVVPQPNITISTYEWTINNSIVLDSASSTSINTNDLSLGDNTISLRVLNSCGSWSEPIIKTINIINEVINMEKIINVTVDEPLETVSIVMDTVGKIDITVKDTSGAVMPGVILELDGVPTGLSTDADGKSSILDVPYGTHTIKAIK